MRLKRQVNTAIEGFQRDCTTYQENLEKEKAAFEQQMQKNTEELGNFKLSLDRFQIQVQTLEDMRIQTEQQLNSTNACMKMLADNTLEIAKSHVTNENEKIYLEIKHLKEDTESRLASQEREKELLYEIHKKTEKACRDNVEEFDRRTTKKMNEYLQKTDATMKGTIKEANKIIEAAAKVIATASEELKSATENKMKQLQNTVNTTASELRKNMTNECDKVNDEIQQLKHRIASLEHEQELLYKKHRETDQA